MKSTARLLVSGMLLTVTSCAGCGRIADDTDAGPTVDAAEDVDVPCTSGTFGKVIALDALNTNGDERGLRFTRDELLGVFARGEEQFDAGHDYSDLFSTSRTSPAGAFTAPINLAVVNGVVQLYPSLVDDAVHSLFYESTCYAKLGEGYWPLCFATRDAAVSPYGNPDEVVFAVTTPSVQSGPFGAGWTTGDGFVTSDGRTYYFVSSLVEDGSADAARGVFAATGDYPPEAGHVVSFTNGEKAVLLAADSNIDDPVLTTDELTMYLSAGDVPHIVMTSRPNKDATFGDLVPVHELDSVEGEYPTWISPDRCRLYFTRRVNGQYDLYEASREP